MSDFINTLQRFTGGREGCFESAAPKVDAAIVCHEVRSVELSPGEQVRVTFRVLGRRDRPGEETQYIEAGDMVTLKSLQLDSVVLMSVWATDDSRIAAAKLQEPVGPLRACGEVRVPLRSLVQKCDGALYHTWLMLDSPGLSDSVASIGLMEGTALGGGADEALSQSLVNAPRQLTQPKACVSLCKVEDLGPSGQPLWSIDAPRKERIAHWGPLLRSQQQHVVMCTAQHLQSAQSQRDQRSQNSSQIANLEAKAADQASELRSLKEQVRAKEAQDIAMEDSIARQEDVNRRARDAGRTTQEMEEQRAIGDTLNQELEDLQEELAKIGEEANGKIESANVRIRALRGERDDAVREVERQSDEVRRMLEERDELSSERAKLSEQKEALLKIVEDLHQTCLSAGLTLSATSGRKSIDSFRFP